MKFEVAATSEWYIDAILVYDKIHHSKIKPKKKSREEILEFLNSTKSFVFSADSKTPCKTSIFKNMSDEKLLSFYNAIINSNNLGSITEITGSQLIQSAGHIDLLTYSFPCQDLSMGASFIGGGAGMVKGSGTRSGLLWEIERILGELREIQELPKYLLLENVKNMLGKSFSPDYEKWIAKLGEMGYETKTMILDSSEFGVPQKRQRVFAVSILKAEGDWEEIFKDLDNRPEIKLPTIKSILREKYEIPKYKEEAVESMVNRTPSRKYIYDQARKLNIDNHKFTKTLTTKQDRNPNSGVISLKGTLIGDVNREGNYANFRFLTPREQFLLMGFTESDFEKTKKSTTITKRKYWVLTGNSIVVNVVEWIFEVLLCKENK